MGLPNCSNSVVIDSLGLFVGSCGNCPVTFSLGLSLALMLFVSALNVISASYITQRIMVLDVRRMSGRSVLNRAA